MIQKSIGLILIFSYFLGAGTARQLFVSSATGDDHHDGTTMALALKTLQYALNAGVNRETRLTLPKASTEWTKNL
ncbi:MAG: hypothetical protein U0T81_12285 [Saprospiraceae bacterium]